MREMKTAMMGFWAVNTAALKLLKAYDSDEFQRALDLAVAWTDKANEDGHNNYDMLGAAMILVGFHATNAEENAKIRVEAAKKAHAKNEASQ